MSPLAALLREVLACLSRNGAEDPGCEAAFALLDQYVEAVRAGGGTAPRFAGVRAHLGSCGACAEDAEGLLAALTRVEE